MAAHLTSNPDVFQAAALIAVRDGTSVDVALSRLHRAARMAGLSPERMACQIIGSLKPQPSSARQALTGRIVVVGTGE